MQGQHLIYSTYTQNLFISSYSLSLVICVQNLTILALAAPEISSGAPKFTVGHVTLTMPLLRVICHSGSGI